MVANLHATAASASHRESEAFQKKVHSFIQEATSICKMVRRMRLLCTRSNRSGWKGGADNVVEGETKTDGLGR